MLISIKIDRGNGCAEHVGHLISRLAQFLPCQITSCFLLCGKSPAFPNLRLKESLKGKTYFPGGVPKPLLDAM